MNFSERLDLAMKQACVTQGGLAKAVNMAQSSINKLLNGAHGSRKSVSIAQVLGVRPEWLATGIGPMREGEIALIEPANHRLPGDDIFRVDVLDVSVSAGPGVTSKEFIEVLRSVEYRLEEAARMFGNRSAEQMRIINVRGDSMSGTIEPGDLLFVDISVTGFDGDGIYAFLYDDTSHVKRLQKMKDKLLVISDNKTYAPWEPIEREEMNRVVIFGKVIGSMPQNYRRYG